ncbi:hypothetical protein SASPL_151618 [Salvia splendens]|uniref:Wall-associated receptor kinase galacturonan-binding domain-containing protein n=1 Tax=Salvia splendens TaxID=180675 RepID=A0A8X8W9Q0_SALSN|nr:hypothetical protein SASPL_151618 [Salvia splendens]
MITQNLLFLIYSSLLILSGSAHSFQTKCPPSSCGLVRNISYPFRLSTCRGPGYELVCENNVTLLYRKSRKYYVKEIDYQYHNIRLSAISTNDNICSLPSYPLDEDIFFSIMFPDFEHLIYLVRCEHPLHNSSLFTQLTDCEQSTKYTYIKLGNLTPNDIDNMCTIVSILTTSGCLQYLNNVSLDPISRCSQILNNASLSEIYQSLLYGFDMSWWSFMCSYCKGGTWGCSPISDGLVDCGHPLSQQYYKWGKIIAYKFRISFLLLIPFCAPGFAVYILDSFRSPKGPTGGCLLILMLILVLLPGAQSIDELPRMVHLEKPYSLSEVTVVSMEVRFIMGFLGGMWFLIYKFRRRHLSAYEEIESFLQNDNHLSPIRGTIGYVTPELINRSIGLVSHKADVYSFGMLLMEMAGVNRELRENKDDSTKYFPDWIYDCINKGKGIVIGEAENTNIDNYNVIGKSVLEKMTIVGLWCIQMNPDNRPSMNTVLEMLEGYVEDLKIPEHPSHLVNEDKSRAADSTGSASQMDYDNGSVIEISIA